MSNETNNIVKQASQGSVAAIIQVLNEELADENVRTRAIFADGVLQLLCEAATAEQLDRSTLPGRIKHTLEAIAPPNIRRVKINSRLVREQQLLWLEEINRDPENQLLWSEEITLRQPNLLQRLFKPHQVTENTASKSLLPTLSPHKLREQRQFWRGLLGGAGLGLLLLAGWLLYQRFGNPTSESAQIPTPATSPLTSSTQAIATDSASPAASPSATANPVTPSPDPFVHAVRIAEKASQEGVSARSLAQWLELAAQWQKASDLMAEVPATDQRYQTAQERVVTYQKNREFALQHVQKLQAEASVGTEQEASHSPEITGQPQ